MHKNSKHTQASTLCKAAWGGYSSGLEHSTVDSRGRWFESPSVRGFRLKHLLKKRIVASATVLVVPNTAINKPWPIHWSKYDEQVNFSNPKRFIDLSPELGLCSTAADLICHKQLSTWQQSRCIDALQFKRMIIVWTISSSLLFQLFCHRVVETSRSNFLFREGFYLAINYQKMTFEKINVNECGKLIKIPLYFIWLLI